MNTTTMIIADGHISINGVPLPDILKEVYVQGIQDGSKADKTELITFENLQSEMAEKGIKTSVQTIARKVKIANIKKYKVFGKNAIRRSDLRHFITNN